MYFTESKNEPHEYKTKGIRQGSESLYLEKANNHREMKLCAYDYDIILK